MRALDENDELKLLGHYSMKIRTLNFLSSAPGAVLDENKELKFFE